MEEYLDQWMHGAASGQQVLRQAVAEFDLGTSSNSPESGVPGTATTGSSPTEVTPPVPEVVPKEPDGGQAVAGSASGVSSSSLRCPPELGTPETAIPTPTETDDAEPATWQYTRRRVQEAVDKFARDQNFLLQTNEDLLKAEERVCKLLRQKDVAVRNLGTSGQTVAHWNTKMDSFVERKRRKLGTATGTPLAKSDSNDPRDNLQ